VPVKVAVMRESDAAAMEELMSRFLRAVSFEQGSQPSYGDLPDLFVPGARLIRNSGPAPEISTVDEFVRARQDSVDAGELSAFEETSSARRRSCSATSPTASARIGNAERPAVDRSTFAA
jgi:hypothetical protein